MKGKILMFAKTSLESFAYDVIDVFYFPDESAKKIYEKYQIKTCFLYQNLTDTGSTSLFFIFICNHGCSVSEKTSRDIIFKVYNFQILNTLDLSDDFGNSSEFKIKCLRSRSVFMRLKA